MLAKTRELRTERSLKDGELSNPCIFSVDVEDWFHILQVPGAPPLSSWDSLPSRVEQNFRHMLDMFSETDTRVTCFFLGWVAERFPHLVREAAARGHEIASHGYAHRLVFEMTAEEFREDVFRARCILENISGRPVYGHRCAGFSATDRSEWFFEKLIEAGYEYDSSIFPAARGHGGITNARRDPHNIQTPSGPIFEFPITVTDVAGRAMCFFGGGYLRLFPYWLIRQMAQRVTGEGRPVMFYIHPREIDPDHPRIPMPVHRRFKSYVNLAGTEGKIRRIMSEFPLITCRDFLESRGLAAFEETGSIMGGRQK
jgi:polysaccharide deacetylase family protein (PEP-CTERM system associated)